MLRLGTVRQWHWISSAIALVGMLMFAVTGITLNHAGDIKVQPQVETLEVQLSAAQLKLLNKKSEGALPLAIRQWLYDEHGINTPKAAAEWDENELYLALPKPGGDAWLSIDLDSGELLYENTSRGVISYLNDLHKGRNTGTAWAWFLDAFSLLCIVFALSGLWLLIRYSKQRKSTWPWVGLGVLIPLLLLILTVH